MSTTSTLPSTSLRGADLGDTVDLLKSLRAHTVDKVASIGALSFTGGMLELNGQEGVFTEDGYFELNGLYRPTNLADTQLAQADMLGIPLTYLRRLRNENVELLDTNLNQLAQMAYRADAGKRILIRTLFGSDPNHPGTAGIARAILSNAYLIQDNLDTVMAILRGLKRANLDIDAIDSIDLSNNKLYMKIISKDVAMVAPEFLRDYRSPFDSSITGDTLPIINAGFEVGNSEVGDGSFYFKPFVYAQVCKNGYEQTVDIKRRRHVGARMAEGLVTRSPETIAAGNALIQSQVTDAVGQFLNEDYLEQVMARMMVDAGLELPSPQDSIKTIGKELRYSDDEVDLIMADFIKGGDMSVKGVVHAVTSAAQRITDVDRAHEFNGTAMAAFESAKSIARASK